MSKELTAEQKRMRAELSGEIAERVKQIRESAPWKAPELLDDFYALHFWKVAELVGKQADEIHAAEKDAEVARRVDNALAGGNLSVRYSRDSNMLEELARGVKRIADRLDSWSSTAKAEEAMLDIRVQGHVYTRDGSD